MECMKVFRLTRRQGTRMLVLTAIHKNAQYRTELWTQNTRQPVVKKIKGEVHNQPVSRRRRSAVSASVFQFTGSPNEPHTFAQVMSTCIERSEKLRQHLFMQKCFNF